MRWPELPEILTHTPCTDGVSSGGFLDKYLSESAALLGFDGCDESLTEEVSAFCGVAVVVTYQQQLRGSFECIGTKKRPECIEERALAVAAFPPQDEQHMLADHACKGIAHGALQKA